MARTYVGAALDDLTRRRPCVYRRVGCRGYAVPTRAKHRAADGTFTWRTVLVCNRCGAAHGPAA